MTYGCSYHTYLSKHVFKLIFQAFCPSPQASLLLTSSETNTAILPEVSAAFIGKWPLLSCKIASLAGSHLVGAVAVSPGSVMVYTSINYNSSYQNKVLCAFSLQTSTMSTWHWGCTTVCLHSAQSSLVLSAVLIGTRWWTYRGPEYHN